MARAFKGLQRRVALGPLLSIAPRDAEWLRSCSEIHKFFDSYIEPAVAGHSKSSARVGGTNTPPSVLQELVGQTQDRHFIRDQLISLFLPAHNSSAISISGLVFQVARAPEVYAKLRAEVLELGDAELTFDVLQSMRYLQCVIKESQ